MKRYTITLGATTTAGGKVISASSNGSINGAKIAVENDLVFCPSCKSQGKIKCIPPRLPELWNGKKVALENDLCLCGCPTPPRLVPAQSLRCQNLAGLNDEDIVGSSQETLQPAVSGVPSFDEKFVLFDEDSEMPLPNVEYAIRRASGRIEHGITNARGETHLLAKTAEAESVDIYL